MRTFRCVCGAALFFDNTVCLTCRRELGFLPDALAMAALEPAAAVGGYATAHGVYAKCANYATEGVCNWMVPGPDGAGRLCEACELNHVIPDLSLPENHLLWAEVEKAKRRLVYGLRRLNLPLQSKRENPEGGLAFDIKADVGGARVLTGHDDGLITLNLAEADAPTREKVRVAMKERYRTLLGHFRHEVGHYYWDRLVRDGGALDAFRALFGDERADYGAALAAHYARPPANDPRFISHYASSHPWEDFAECFAHVLHMDDTLETARAYGIPAAGPEAAGEADGPGKADRPARPEVEDFDETLARWCALTVAVNALNRSMGTTDAYPFDLSPKVAEKLRFVHRLVRGLPVALTRAPGAPRSTSRPSRRACRRRASRRCGASGSRRSTR